MTRLWEIALKLSLAPSLAALPDLLEGLGLTIVAINERHAVASVDREPATRNPFDRMLLSQCQVEGLRLVTIDRSPVSHRWRRRDRDFRPTNAFSL